MDSNTQEMFKWEDYNHDMHIGSRPQKAVSILNDYKRKIKLKEYDRRKTEKRREVRQQNKNI